MKTMLEKQAKEAHEFEISQPAVSCSFHLFQFTVSSLKLTFPKIITTQFIIIMKIYFKSPTMKSDLRHSILHQNISPIAICKKIFKFYKALRVF